ncbi:MAG: hypothetical protein WC855_11715 [Thermodesulfovibrionales bacterium]
MNDNDRIKALSDVDLELEAQRISPKAFPNHPTLRERESRRLDKEREDSSNAREANLLAREALRITRQDRTIAIIAIIIAIASFIVTLLPPSK